MPGATSIVWLVRCELDIGKLNDDLHCLLAAQELVPFVVAVSRCEKGTWIAWNSSSDTIFPILHTIPIVIFVLSLFLGWFICIINVFWVRIKAQTVADSSVMVPVFEACECEIPQWESLGDNVSYCAVQTLMLFGMEIVDVTCDTEILSSVLNMLTEYLPSFPIFDLHFTW